MIAVVLSVLGLLAGGAGVTLAIAANNRAGRILAENTELIRSQLAAAGIGAAGTGAAGTAAAGTAAARTAAARTGSLDPRAIRDVALVRYDALKEMAGQLSFSIAMLNAAGDGIVLTSINGRSETRTYAKTVCRRPRCTVAVARGGAVGTFCAPRPEPAGGACSGRRARGWRDLRAQRSRAREALADGAASWLAPSARLVAVRSCCLCWGDST